VVPVSSYSTGKNGKADYFTLSGTSMATPMVSGAAALLIQNEPQITPDTVKARLMKSATKGFPATSIFVDPVTGQVYTSQYDIFTIGAGYLDIMGALALHDVANGGTQSPAVFYDSVSGNAYIIQDDVAVWGTVAVWRKVAVWGTNVALDTGSAVYANVAVWGTRSAPSGKA
jgi:serine protease AprX